MFVQSHVASQRDQAGKAWMSSCLLDEMAKMYCNRVYLWCEEPGLCAENTYHMLVNVVAGAFPAPGAKKVTVFSLLCVSVCMQS